MIRPIPKANYYFSICLTLFLLFNNRAAAQIYAGGAGDGFSLKSFAQADNVLLNIYAGGNSDGFSINCFAQASNVLYNIYGGGNADGFSINCFAQASNVLYDIYKGGSEDGFGINCFAQASNVLYDIYKGGTEDGFSLSCFAQASNVLYDIYKGGNNDGFSINCFAQVSNALYDIYNGGIQDGFALNTFAQANNVLYDIYKGGIGDGLSKFCLGTLVQIPLPVELLDFKGKYENNKILLQWSTASEMNNDYFSLERSANAHDFAQIYKVEGAGTTSQQRNYSFEDEDPIKGINYYRLKQVDFDLKVTYSGVVSVYAEQGASAGIYIYPNPSDNTMVVRVLLKGAGTAGPTEFVITDIYGQLITSFSAATDVEGKITLPASVTSTLSTGVYLVSVRFGTNQVTRKWVIK